MLLLFIQEVKAMALLFKILATILMLINTIHVIHIYLSLRKSDDSHMLLNKKIRFFFAIFFLLLVCFLFGYVVILLSNNGNHCMFFVILSQLIFWGAVFVMISIHIFKALIRTTNQQFFLEKSDLQLSLDTYLKSIPGGVHHCEIEPEMRVTYVNKGFTDLSGFTIDEIKERHNGKYIGIIHKDDIDTFMAALEHLLKTMTSVTVTYRIVTKRGETIWVSDSMNAVKDSKGFTHIFAVVMDITTERTNAETDPLTGLLNKRAFDARTREYMSLNPQKNIGLFMIDLNFFKGVNDKYGHQIGDSVLVEAAKHFISLFSNEDAVIGRIGGDEFMVLVKDAASDEHLLALQNRLNGAFKSEIPDAEDFPPVSVSAGYVFASCFEDFDTIYRRADVSMYKAKESAHAMRNSAAE